MTPLQQFIQYLAIANFMINVFSFINIKPDLSHVFDEFTLREKICEVCDRQEIDKN